VVEDATLTSISMVGDAFIAVGDITVGGSANALALVSTDGVSWALVSDEDAFAGINNAIWAATSTPNGLLAVGSRWDSELTHPVPVAWLADR
jgi:hypothetical protein